jgi:quinol monooxygenase YgiN
MTDFAAFQSVVELRRYTLHPGRRDELIELFEREFVETQEATGMHLFGQFREPAGPDRFVWLRGFRDMETRRAALESFYSGPVWREHGPAANATMIDASDVLLLRPSGPGFPAPDAPRPAGGDSPGSRILVTVCHPSGPVKEFAEFFAQNVDPVLRESGVDTFGWFETEPAENTFPGSRSGRTKRCSSGSRSSPVRTNSWRTGGSSNSRSRTSPGGSNVPGSSGNWLRHRGHCCAESSSASPAGYRIAVPLKTSPTGASGRVSPRRARPRPRRGRKAICRPVRR